MGADVTAETERQSAPAGSGRGPSERISTFAREVAADAGMRQAVISAALSAVEQNLAAAIERTLSKISPGEIYKLYGPHTTSDTREQRERRIREALQGGQPPEQIAKREQITERHVRRIRARIGGGGTGY